MDNGDGNGGGPNEGWDADEFIGLIFLIGHAFRPLSNSSAASPDRKPRPVKIRAEPLFSGKVIALLIAMTYLTLILLAILYHFLIAGS